MIKALDSFNMIKISKILVIVVFLGCSAFAKAQSSKPSKADKLFENRSYVRAIELYQEMKPTKQVLQNLGDAYYYTGKLDEAVQAYKTLFEKKSKGIKQEYAERYSHALKGTGNVKKADSILNNFTDLKVNTDSLTQQLNKILPHKYIVQEVGNSEAGDFGASFYKDTIVFASIRSKAKSNYKWNDEPYLDLYMGQLSEENELVDIQPFSEDINTKTHESNASFTINGEIMFFSRTNDRRVEIKGQKIAHVKVFKADLLEGEWENIEVLPFSSDFYSTQHPYLDKNEPKLYFSSDMSNNNGNFDLYYVEIDKNGTYGKPVNLGEEINTGYREHFPFIDDDGSLYFASDRPDGYGGLDIYFCRKREDGSFTPPINLGETVNSGRDDFSYYYSKNYEKGFLSSNRTGNDKLYFLERDDNDRTFVIKGAIIDAITKEPLTGTTVTLIDENGEIVEQMLIEDGNGYSFNVLPNTKYQIEGYKPFYITKTEGIETKDEGFVEFDIELQLESYDSAEDLVVTDQESGYVYIQLENIYFDLDKSAIKPQAAQTLNVLVDLLNKYPRMEVQLGAHTDSRNSDSYNLRLSKDRADATMNYLISQGIPQSRLTSKGYGESEPLVPCGDSCTEDEYSINRRCEFLILR
jgi:outer membrane protein OmpA-like peptidoglycan-associated protein